MIAVLRHVLTGLPVLSFVAGAVLLVGCAASDIVENEPVEPSARQIIQSGHCGLTGPGLAYAKNHDQLQKLLELPTQNLAVQQLRQVNLEHEHLLFVTLGEKPTGGYSVSLASVQGEEATLRLAVKVREPAPGAMVTQAITSPCVVVAIPAADWSEIRVSGLRDTDIAVKP